MPNRLIHERSPYLLQHAFNPVDWYPWGEEAFEKARADQKPIFLSVGYSTCHWCHVMERESFENERIAGILNKHFVSIKVDREERPDIDRIYMNALQAMGQNGGWPMSMFLTPDREPFYGGTYFPPETRYGRTGLADILQRIQEAWETERQKVNESAESITRFLLDASGSASRPGRLDEGILEKCFQDLKKTYDSIFGGFGGGPKFPRPVVLHFLLRHHHRTGNPFSLEMAEKTLQKMFAGGIYDHVGGGFHRYSVDGEWRVPHFEKMLYDQAQLITAYVAAYRRTWNPLYAAVARETIQYVLRDLTDPEGGFYSAEDADSARPEHPEEEGEGAFYVWTKREISEVLGPEVEAFCHYYGIEATGNASFDPQQEFTGRNILYVAHTVAETAQTFGSDQGSIRLALALGRKGLQMARARRPRPHRDDKILAGWNGMMIGALANASTVLREPEYLNAARRAAEFLFHRLFSPERDILLRRYRDGESRIEGQLDDYANVIQGLLALYEASLEPVWLMRAMDLMRKQLKFFWDDVHGAFYDTPGADRSLLVRMKERHDGAEPTGNSVAAFNLIRLSRITGNQEWRSLAERTIAFFAAAMEDQPVVLPNMVSALDSLLVSPPQIVVAGRRGDPLTESLLDTIWSRTVPDSILLFLEEGAHGEELRSFLQWTSAYTTCGGKSAAYVCRNYVCQLPISDPTQLAEALDDVSSVQK